MHKSVKLNTPCEFINVTPLNPLISKCQIKVCYVGDEPNRNKSIITKETARQMANSLPGSPIVGFFNEATGDFEEHNRSIDISNGQFRVKDTTKPYGFVDLGAKVWFQKFLDDDQIEHEYLMTEGYLWTGQYPETKRILEHGNNHSMELDENYLDANWTKDSNGKPQFFIINEAIISKLCILGEEFEPCFEGSNITNLTYSFDDDFKQEVRAMMNELKDYLNKGGTQVFTTYAVKVGDSIWNALYEQVHDTYSIVSVCEDAGQKYAVLQNKENKEFFSLDFSANEDSVIFAGDMKAIEYTPSEEPQFALADVEAFEATFKKNSEEEDKKKEDSSADKEAASSKDDDSKKEDDTADKKADDTSEDKESSDKESDDKDKKDEEDNKKKKYSLEEIPEYVELVAKYNALVAEKENLESQMKPLQEFKLKTERVQKEDMIKSFYMLSDEDKSDVVKNIDTYSLDQIEAKLSIICVRNKVSFAAAEDDQPVGGPTTYNLGGELFQDESTPAWVKAVLDTAKTLN